MFQADYYGPLSRDWGDMIFERVDAPIEYDGDLRRITGVLEHGLPATLKDVNMILITSNRSGDRMYAERDGQEQPWVRNADSHGLPNVGQMISYSAQGWAPGAPLNLSEAFDPSQGRTSLQLNLTEAFTNNYKGNTSIGGAISQGEAKDYLQMLSLYHMLLPPEYLRSAGDGGLRFRRAMARELDLSGWFNRPCLIVTGFLEQTPCPTPLTIDGGPPEASEGLTMVRWIFPLPLDEVDAFRLDQEFEPQEPPNDA